MTKILMVCLGNICRSPLAHGILASKLSPSEYFVDSAGTASYHIGEKPDNRSIRVAQENGVNISNQRARAFDIQDFDEFDIIFAMDRSNYSDILNLARNQDDKSKVKLFLEANSQIEHKDVPDPYYGDQSDFQYVFDLIDETCDILITQI